MLIFENSSKEYGISDDAADPGPDKEPKSRDWLLANDHDVMLTECICATMAER
jgi:hypothetical protein